VARKRLLYRRIVCHGFATLGVEPPHRLLQAHFRGMQVRRGLRQVCVTEHLLDMMDRPARRAPRLVSRASSQQHHRGPRRRWESWDRIGQGEGPQPTPRNRYVVDLRRRTRSARSAAHVGGSGRTTARTGDLVGQSSSQSRPRLLKFAIVVTAARWWVFRRENSLRDPTGVWVRDFVC